MIVWGAIGLAAARLLGQALLSVLSVLLAGRTFKYILLYPFVKLSQWTRNPITVKIVQEAEKDLGLEGDFTTSTPTTGDTTDGK